MTDQETSDQGFTPPPAGTRAVRAGRPGTARLRAAPVREEPVREEKLTREGRLTRRRKRSEDKFYIDPKIIPPGVSYEWKAESCYGAANTYHITNLKENHWREVPVDRHPGQIVRQDGQILMERPKYLTEEAQIEDYEIAMSEVQRVSQGITDTPSGTMTRNHPSVKRVAGVKKSFETSLSVDSQGHLVVPE
jgi:hypothetical protein